MDATTVGALVTLAGVVGGIITKAGDMLIGVINARSAKRKAELEAQRNVDDGVTNRRDITVNELWDLVKNQKSERERDRENYVRERDECNARMDKYESELDRCHEDHRKSEFDRGRALARIDILEEQVRQLGGKLRPWNPEATGTLKPLPPDKKEGDK